MKAFLTSLFVGSKSKITGIAPIASHADSASSLLAQAKSAVRSESFSVAASLCQQLVDAGSLDPDVYVSYGYALLSLQEFSKAKIALLKAVELDEQNADAHYMLGSACNAVGDTAGAVGT